MKRRGPRVVPRRQAMTGCGLAITPRRQARPKRKGTTMIFIVVKWTIRPDWSHEWRALADEFTQATRNEEGNLFFEWSRSVDTPHQFVLVEAFASSEAG